MWLDQRVTTPHRSKLEKAATLIYILPTALFEKYSKKSSLMDKYGEFNHITTCRCEGLKSNYNHETYKLIKFKKFVAIEGFYISGLLAKPGFVAVDGGSWGSHRKKR